MNISSIGSTDTISALSALSNPDNAASADAALGTPSTPASSSKVSKPGELLAKLSQLLQQDPAKFKQVTQKISDELQASAANASGPQAEFLNKLSEHFAAASSSGSVSPLEPQAGEHSGAPAAHHHHHGAGHHDASPGMPSVLSTALDQVNQALSAATTSAAAG
jgi:hypothetical protein